MIIKILALIIICIAFNSCAKEYCWKCTTTVRYYAGSSTPSTGESSLQVCDKTQDEIRKYEQDNSGSKQGRSGNVVVTIITTVKCTK